jgi:hypothetical protein
MAEAQMAARAESSASLTTTSSQTAATLPLTALELSNTLTPPSKLRVPDPMMLSQGFTLPLLPAAELAEL